MRKLFVLNHVTLDGVMQAPGRPDEDRRGGFQHGGWAIADGDAIMMQALTQPRGQGVELLLGRRTYEDFFAVWPKRTDSSFSAMLDNQQKYGAEGRWSVGLQPRAARPEHGHRGSAARPGHGDNRRPVHRR
jgi:hypothetical protein